MTSAEPAKATEKKSFGIVLINRTLMFSEILLVSEIFVREQSRILDCTFWSHDRQMLLNPNTMNLE